MDRLLFFLPSLAVGGAESSMVSLANELVGEVEVHFAFGASGPLEDELLSAIKKWDLKSDRTLGCLPGLVELLESVQPKWLLSTLNYANVVAIWAKVLARSNTKVAIREATSWARVGDVRNSYFQRSLPTLLPSIFRKANVVLVPSSQMVKEIEQSGLKVHLLPSPVITPQLQERANRKVRRKRPYVLAVGRLVWEKGFDVLLNAWSLADASNTHDLLLLGEGPERNRLEGMVGQLGMDQHVEMPGFEPNPFKYMRNADLFVLSSRYEGMPNVLIQALACGARVVSTDCPTGPHEVLNGGQFGLLVGVDDARALARAIDEALAAEPLETLDLQNYTSEASATTLMRILREQD